MPDKVQIQSERGRTPKQSKALQEDIEFNFDIPCNSSRGRARGIGRGNGCSSGSGSSSGSGESGSSGGVNFLTAASLH